MHLALTIADSCDSATVCIGTKDCATSRQNALGDFNWIRFTGIVIRYSDFTSGRSVSFQFVRQLVVASDKHTSWYGLSTLGQRYVDNSCAVKVLNVTLRCHIDSDRN